MKHPSHSLQSQDQIPNWGLNLDNIGEKPMAT